MVAVTERKGMQRPCARHPAVELRCIRDPILCPWLPLCFPTLHPTETPCRPHGHLSPYIPDPLGGYLVG